MNFAIKGRRGFPTRPLTERFWEKVSPEPNTGCFLWTGAHDDPGYGSIGVDGKTRRAPRVAWELTRGPIPDGLYICHRCDNPACVNPDHLFLGTPSDNSVDAFRKGRLCERPRSQQTHCQNGHEFTPENTMRNKAGHRRCRVCNDGWRRARALRVQPASAEAS